MHKPSGGTIHRFMVHVVPGVIKPIHALWNQLIGFIFIVLALGAVPYMIRDSRKFDGGADSLMRLSVEGIFAAVMLYFGVSSLLRARRITRS